MKRHPSEAELGLWMTGGPDEGIGTHLEECAVCADVCTQLTEQGDTLPDVLVDALTPDHRLEDRVMDGVSATLAGRAATEAFLELFGVGVETAKVVFGQEDQS